MSDGATTPTEQHTNQTKTIFIGSSSAANQQVKGIIETLQTNHVRFLPWWSAITGGQILLEGLRNIAEEVDGALLVFSPDYPAKIRGGKKQIPNLNVLFELGFFYGALGKDKVAMIAYGQFYLPSNLGGYRRIIGSTDFKRAGAVDVGGKTVNDFLLWSEKL